MLRHYFTRRFCSAKPIAQQESEMALYTQEVSALHILVMMCSRYTMSSYDALSHLVHSQQLTLALFLASICCLSSSCSSAAFCCLAAISSGSMCILSLLKWTCSKREHSSDWRPEAGHMLQWCDTSYPQGDSQRM